MANRPRKHLLALFLTLVAVVAVLAVLWAGEPTKRLLAKRFQAELQAAPADQVDARLAQLAALDEAGLPALVAALNSRRDEIARGAHQTLVAQLDRWQRLPPEMSSRQVALLARLLAEQQAGFAAPARQAAGQLVERIVLWPIDRSEIDGPQLVADCETVLLAAAPLPPRDAPAFEPAATASDAEPPGDAASRDDPRPRWGDAAQTRAWAPRSSPADPPAAPPATPPPVVSDGPAVNLSAASDSSALPPPPDPPTGPPAVERLPARDPVAQAAPQALDLPSLETVDVIPLLATDATQSAAADELARRGFTTLHIELAKQLVDPDPQVRKQLAVTLPRIAGIDARPWLVWLSRDEDSRVRKAAVAVMATSSDATLQARLREIEREEPDPEVLRVVRQGLGDTRRE